MPFDTITGFQSSKARSAAGTSLPGLYLNLIATVIALSIFGLSVSALWETRNDAWRDAEQSSSNLLSAVSRDIGGNIELFDLSLKGVVQGLGYDGLDKLPRDIQHLILFDRAATTTYMGSILVLNEAGDVVADAAAVVPRPGNFADRDYFLVHKNPADVGLYISRPYRSRLRNGDLSFAISRRLSHPDGSFAGVVMGAISLSNLRSAFASLKLGKDGALNLLRNDGVILMRQPFVEEDINRDLSKSENFQRFVRERSGAFVGTSSVDGVRRLFTFAPVGRLPVFLTVAVSVEEILSSWWKKAVVLGVITTLLCSAVVSLTYLFQRELSRRRIAEAELAQLASTDGLTGLPNRRAFDATLAREWADAIRSGRPLSVLFIDADFFKGFNDHYGHGKGDDLLTTIAKVVRSELHRPRDYVARYGGEEFTILLPDADLGHALTVAENMRNALLGRGILHATSSHNVATISVGVASIVPLQGMNADSLLVAADAALYRAKASGRNCIKSA